MAVPLFDLARVLEPLRPQLLGALDRCLRHGVFVLGPEVTAFEKAFAAYTGAEHVIGVSSGTDALLLTFMALEQRGLQPGDEVLCTPFTFIATATSVLRAGLRPVFVDLAPGKFYPDVEQFRAAWTPKTKAVLNVHLFGEPQPLDALAALCQERGALLIEDCAQAHGARQPDGKSVGKIGLAGAFSFFPAKNLGALGDGGAVITDDAELAQRVREKRQHGGAVRYQFNHLGGNFRLDALHAAFLQTLLPELDGWVAKRQANARAYDAAWAAIGDDKLQLPAQTPGHAWNQYVVRTPHRDALKVALEQAGIGVAVYYPTALHQLGALAAAHPATYLPETEKTCREVLAVPVYPGLREDERDEVIAAVQAFFARA
jgi:dTDP-4-amino-4,6-dideoxygalactose transaminase